MAHGKNDKQLQTDVPQYAGLEIKPVRDISSWGIAKMSENRHDCESPIPQRSRRGEQACEITSVKYDDVGTEPLPPSFVAKSGGYFLPFFCQSRKH